MGVGFIKSNCIYHLFFLYIPWMTWLFPLKFIFVTSGLSPSHFYRRAANFFFCLQLPFKYDLTHLNFMFNLNPNFLRNKSSEQLEFHLFLCAFVCTAGLGYSHVPRCWKFGVCRVWLCWYLLYPTVDLYLWWSWFCKYFSFMLLSNFLIYVFTFIS